MRLDNWPRWGVSGVVGILIAIAPMLRRADSVASAQLTTTSVDSIDEDDVRESLAWIIFDEPDEELLEQILLLGENRLDLNRAKISELARVPFLTEREALTVLDLRAKLRRFSSLSELLLLGFEGEEIRRKLEPFVRIGPSTAGATNVRMRARKTERISVEREHGATESSRLDFLNRVRVAMADRFGGEILFRATDLDQAPERFVSAYLEGKDLGMMRHLVIGDFSLQDTRGGFSSLTGNVAWQDRSTNGLFLPGCQMRPHLSTSGLPYLRGVGAVLAWQMRDVEVRALTLWSTNSLSFFHSSSAPAGEADAERVMGGRIEAAFLHGMCAGFSVFVRNSEDSENRNQEGEGPEERSEMYCGFDVRAAFSSGNLFAAIGRLDGSLQILCGGAVDAGKMFHTAFTFCRSVASPLLRITGESRSLVSGQVTYGASVSCQLDPIRTMRISGTVEIARREQIASGIPLHERRTCGLLELEYDVSPSCHLRLRFREQSRFELTREPDDNGLVRRQLAEKVVRDFKGYATFRMSGAFQVRSRVQATWIRRPAAAREESGILVSEEVVLHPQRVLSITSSLSFFHTGSYDSRVYLWEADLPGLISSPAAYDRGRRWSIYARLKFGKWGSLSVKYARTNSDRSIERNDADTAIGIQFDAQF